MRKPSPRLNAKTITCRVCIFSGRNDRFSRTAERGSRCKNPDRPMDRWNPGLCGPSRLRDLSRWRGGRALEVTIAVPHEYARMYGQIHQFGVPIESDLLEYTWQIWLDPVAANLRNWDRDRVVYVVRAVEQDGVESHRELRDPLLKEELARLGISGMHRFLAREGVQKLYLAAKGWGGFVDGGAVDRLVAEKIEVKSRQLREMTGERHLFVWVSLGQWEAAAAFNDEPPLDSPDLPDVVDTVWVVPMFGRLDSIWRRDRGSGWQVLAVADHHNPYK